MSLIHLSDVIDQFISSFRRIGRNRDVFFSLLVWCNPAVKMTTMDSSMETNIITEEKSEQKRVRHYEIV